MVLAGTETPGGGGGGVVTEDGKGWGVVEGGGWGETIYLTRQCHHQKHFCIKMGSDGSHFNNTDEKKK